MKKKFVGSALVVVFCTSCALTWAATKDALAASTRGYGATDSQLQMLDSQLARQLQDFLELADVVTRQMQQPGARELGGEMLLLVGGSADPIEAAPVQVPVETQTVSTDGADSGINAEPWSTRYLLELIMTSDAVRAAVINGTYVHAGDNLDDNVTVISIADKEVVLERDGERSSLVPR